MNNKRKMKTKKKKERTFYFWYCEEGKINLYSLDYGTSSCKSYHHIYNIIRYKRIGKNIESMVSGIHWGHGTYH
jgi:hypothetical protein